jgi:transcriptional regulator GlxA family with amidase domain
MEISPVTYLYKRIVAAKLFMDKHYSETMDLENIADEACFSKFHFIRVFKSIYKVTPHRYLTQVRITKAKLLLESGYRVHDTCIRVGFDSIPSFIALFRKHTGSNPLEYQQRHKQRLMEIKSEPFKFVPACFVSALN